MSPGDRTEDVNEQSPLINAQETGHDDDVEAGSISGILAPEDPASQSKSFVYLILLTISVGGLQLVWSVELSNGSPYLLSLGMSKALVAFVWLAGPFTGVVVQPYIGMLSDRCRISWGKRKPFMLGGAIGICVFSLLLAYAKDIVWGLGPWAKDAEYEGWWMGLTITLATVMMWCLDFSINTVQAAIRCFIVDNAPAHQQESANAWASRMTGMGNVLGFVFGFLDLPRYFSFLGNTEFKVLCMIASISIASTVLISSLTIKERNPKNDPPSKNDNELTGLISFCKQTIASYKRLTPTVRRVCEIQFFHWLGWFPFLFYVTTYIGQLYVNPRLRPDMSKEEVDVLWEEATRVGTLALLIEAIVSVTANILIPFIIEPTYEAPSSSHRAQSSGHNRSYAGLNLDSILARVQIPGLTLRKTWFFTQILHALCMFSTFFISTPTAATIMVSLVGLSWALTLWAPFALISADIARRDEEHRLRQRKFTRGEEISSTEPEAAGLMNTTVEPATEEEEEEGRGGDHEDASSSPSDSHSNKGSSSSAAAAAAAAAEEVYKEGQEDDDDDDDHPDQAGIILGLHNVAVSLPQVIATLICSIIFKALQKKRNEPNDTSVAWTLRLGGIAALAAAWFTWRMKDNVR